MLEADNWQPDFKLFQEMTLFFCLSLFSFFQDYGSEFRVQVVWINALLAMPVGHLRTPSIKILCGFEIK